MSAAENQHHAAELANQEEQERRQGTTTLYGVFMCPCGSAFTQADTPDGRRVMTCTRGSCKSFGIWYETPHWMLTPAKEPLP